MADEPPEPKQTKADLAAGATVQVIALYYDRDGYAIDRKTFKRICRHVGFHAMSLFDDAGTLCVAVWPKQ